MDLPDLSGEARITLLVIEPHLIHAYWEITSETLEKVRHELGKGFMQLKAVLRFYDITNTIFDGTSTNNFFDVEADLQSKNHYVHLSIPERSYFAELGFKTKEGRFFPVAQSNIAETPGTQPSPKGNTRYMLISGNSKEIISETEAWGRAFPCNGMEVTEREMKYGKESNLDLTEMSEKKFTTGESSELAASIPKIPR